MKSLAIVSLGFFALLGAGQTYANELFPLAYPTDIPPGNEPADRQCVATAFAAGDSVTGTCRSAVAGTCAGRGCIPPITSTVYVASWDNTGNVLSDQFCGTAKGSRPPLTWTYAPGFSAATCYLPTNGTTQIVVYDPRYGFEHWFGYITTSPDGAYELLTYGQQGFINQF